MTDKELRDYYDAHSTLSDGLPIRPVKMSFPKPRELVAMRLDEHTIEAVKKVAARKGLNFSTLIRMWINERLHEERR